MCASSLNYRHGSEHGLLTSECCGGWDRSAAPACLWISPTLAAVRAISCLQHTNTHTKQSDKEVFPPTGSLSRALCVCTLLEPEEETVPWSEPRLRWASSAAECQQ